MSKEVKRPVEDTEMNKIEQDWRENVSDQNLGLDGDHSSDPPSLLTRLNDDNDRISGNPDGESDESGDETDGFYTSLEDK